MRYLSVFVLVTLFSQNLHAEYKASIHKISNHTKERMIKGHSYKKGCPVPLSELRYLQMRYRGFDGMDHMGEMIVNRSMAQSTVDIFHKLYDHNYPIRGMRLVSDFLGSDWRSIEADNTSAFNCRPVTGGKKWSNHAYGKAIDINPIENPYISKSGNIAHKASLKYRHRKRASRLYPDDRAVILKGDYIVKIFKQHGWRWGGDWRYIKDYQHFDKNRR